MSETLVLVAEDSALNRKLVGSILQKLGCQVEMAQDGQEAVQAVGARRYAAVLMDCQMPVMDGFQAARAIRALDAPGARLPIIALTGSDSESERQKCLEAGMDDFLSKPVTLDGLSAAIARWVPAARST